MEAFVEILKSYQTYGLVAFVVTIFGTVIAIRVARHLGLMDMPDQQLKPHACPTPYLGGVAICLGWSVTLIVAMATGRVEWHILLPILLGGILISLVGLVDDLYDVAPKVRLLAAIVIIAVVLLVTGAGFRLVSSALTPFGVDPPPVLAVPVSFVIGLFVVLGACNSANLIDGLDGLCSGVTAIIALGFFVLAGHLAAWEYSREGDPARLVLAMAMFGAAVGFLPLNFAPARIFMGDAGSTLLGFNCGMIILMFGEQGILRWVLGGLMVFALPIVDTSLAVVRRWFGRRPIFAGDRSHFYDQLVDRGMSVRKVVTISYAVAASYAILGCLAIGLRTRYVIPLYMIVAVVTVITLSRAGMIKPEGPPSKERGERRRIKLLFTSAGRRVSLIEQFRRAADDLGVELHICAADYQPMAPALHIASEQLIVPAVTADDYCDCLVEYCRRHEITALIPLIDPELQPLADARDRFAGVGTRAIISSPEVIRTSIDKVRTNEFLRRHEFLTPRILTGEELASPTFPLFIKPRIGSSSLGAHKIETPEALAYYRKRDPDSIVQEFVDGVEYTVDVFADFAGRPRCAVPRRRHEVRGGEVSKGQAIRNERIMTEACRLVEALEACQGMITIQCFLTRDDDIVFIEINSRFGGGVPLSIRAGADSPRWLLELLLGGDPEIAMDGWTDGLLMLRYDEAVFVPGDGVPGIASTSEGTG